MPYYKGTKYPRGAIYNHLIIVDILHGVRSAIALARCFAWHDTKEGSDLWYRASQASVLQNNIAKNSLMKMLQCVYGAHEDRRNEFDDKYMVCTDEK